MLNAFLNVGTACTSMLSLYSITLEQYLAIFHDIHLTNGQITLGSALIWIGTTLLVGLPGFLHITNEAISLNSSKLGCVGSWHKQTPISLMLTWAACMTTMLTTNFNIYAYARIIKLYWQKRKLDHKQTDTTKQPQVQNISKPITIQEKKLLIRAITLCLCFIFCWYMYLLLMIISSVTGRPVQPWFDVAASYCGQMNAILNPILLYSFDGRIRKSCKQVFGFELLNHPNPKQKVSKPSEMDLENTQLSSKVLVKTMIAN
jgi:hypothetical protein